MNGDCVAGTMSHTEGGGGGGGLRGAAEWEKRILPVLSRLFTAASRSRFAAPTECNRRYSNSHNP